MRQQRAQKMHTRQISQRHKPISKEREQASEQQAAKPFCLIAWLSRLLQVNLLALSAFRLCIASLKVLLSGVDVSAMFFVGIRAWRACVCLAVWLLGFFV